MKESLIIIAVVILMFSSFMTGKSMNEKCPECPENLSVALKGCEVTANTVENELEQTRWRSEKYKELYIEMYGRYADLEKNCHTIIKDLVNLKKKEDSANKESK